MGESPAPLSTDLQLLYCRVRTQPGKLESHGI